MTGRRILHMRRPREALNVWAQTCFDEVLEADPEIQFVSTELAAFDDGAAPAGMIPEKVGPDIELYDDQSALARSLRWSSARPHP
jgi:hypothetical protein